MLVICLLATSFTGCLGSDDIVDEVPVEEETIEPVGTGDNGGNDTTYYYYNNDTYYVNGTDYLELISQVENLTVEVEELTIEVEDLTYEVTVLTDEIKDLTSGMDKLNSTIDDMTYDPAEYSNITLRLFPYSNTNEWRTLNFSKMGNTLHMSASFDIPSDREIWFYDNNNQLISYGDIANSFDRCYTNGNWTTSYSECTGDESVIIYEFNLLREPLSVAYGESPNIESLESFP